MSKKELKNLSPEEKLKKLREIEKEKKKEIKEAQEEIKKIEEEKQFLDLEKELEEELAVKDIEAKDNDDKESEDESLEETIARENIEFPPEFLNTEYAQQMGQQPVQKLYDEMVSIYQNVHEQGYMTEEQQQRVMYIAAGAEVKFDAIEDGTYGLTQEKAKKTISTQKLGAHLLGHDARNSYKGNTNNMYQP